MPERPLLVLPLPTLAGKATGPRGGGGPGALSPQRQQERLGPRIQELEAALEAKRLAIQVSTTDLQPDEVLVLETAGSLEEFYKAVHKTEGFEFLGEFDEESVPPDDDFFVSKDGAKTPKAFRGRVYLVFTNQAAFRQLLNLWKTWQNGDELPRGTTKWRDVFSHLRDIRFWSAADRLDDTGVLEDWAYRLSCENRLLPCELELFFRRSPAQRLAAATRVREAVEAAGGSVQQEAVIEDICYHAFSVRLPIDAVQHLLDGGRDLQLVQVESIQFLRASGQMIGRCPTREPMDLQDDLQALLPPVAAEPLVALLDGLPLEQHQALAGRLRVDDPEDLSAEYPTNCRRHGTAMASLIIWGDLHRPGEALTHPLYVRPILSPSQQPLSTSEIFEEKVADNILIVDLVHRAVRRIFEGEGGEEAAAPSVKVINLSIGIRDRPFIHSLSPLARLLDWLAWKYQVLFIISAGNAMEEIPLDAPWSHYADKPIEAIQQAALKGISADTRNRRLFSPAETINGLTVASIHYDEGTLVTPSNPNWIDPIQAGFPSPFNRHGPGYRRALKPDLLAPGGRAVLRKPVLDSKQSLALVDHDKAPGQCVASPGALSGDLNATTNSYGTSNATALTSRAAALLMPVLDDLRTADFDGGTWPRDVPYALWIKALVAHSARWGHAGRHYRKVFESADNGNQLRSQLGRFLGCGLVSSDPIRECTATCVTALSGGTLSSSTGALHRFPLPPSLSGKRGWRSLVVTLAWFTPIQPLSERWRRAHLWFKAPDSRLQIGSGKQLTRSGADWQATQRGTLQHEVFEGEKVSAFVDGDAIIVHVSCREDAGPLAESVPYALAITLEVDPGIGEIYTEVRDRIFIRERIEAKG